MQEIEIKKLPCKWHPSGTLDYVNSNPHLRETLICKVCQAGLRFINNKNLISIDSFFNGIADKTTNNLIPNGIPIIKSLHINKQKEIEDFQQRILAEKQKFSQVVNNVIEEVQSYCKAKEEEVHKKLDYQFELYRNSVARMEEISKDIKLSEGMDKEDLAKIVLDDLITRFNSAKDFDEADDLIHRLKSPIAATSLFVEKQNRFELLEQIIYQHKYNILPQTNDYTELVLLNKKLKADLDESMQLVNAPRFRFTPNDIRKNIGAEKLVLRAWEKKKGLEVGNMEKNIRLSSRNLVMDLRHFATESNKKAKLQTKKPHTKVRKGFTSILMMMNGSQLVSSGGGLFGAGGILEDSKKINLSKITSGLDLYCKNVKTLYMNIGVTENKQMEVINNFLQNCISVEHLGLKFMERSNPKFTKEIIRCVVKHLNKLKAASIILHQSQTNPTTFEQTVKRSFGKNMKALEISYLKSDPHDLNVELYFEVDLM